jgi:hypothetical protein
VSTVSPANPDEQSATTPSASTIHSCTAVNTLLTSFHLRESRASANLVAGSKATNTTVARIAIMFE